MRLTFIIVFILFSQTIIAQNDIVYNYEFALIEANRQKSIGNLNEAINLYRKCLSVKAESGIAAYELGNIYITLNDTLSALEYFKKAYISDPDNYWYRIAYIEILKIKEAYDEATNIILSYLNKKDDPNLRYSLAGIYVIQKKYRKAHKQLDMIELNGGISESIVLKRAEIYKKQNNIKKGENELLRLKDYLPESADYYILLAEYLSEAGLKDKAAEFFFRAYMLDSTNLYAITNLADYHIQNKEFIKGFGYLEKAFSDPQIKLENKLKTIVYYLENKTLIIDYSTEIEKLVNSLLKLYPQENIVTRVAYDFYLKRENYEKAYIQIKNLIELEKDNYALWQQTLYFASLLGLDEELITLGKKAISYFPNKADLYLFVGIGYYQKSDFRSAYDILKENYVIGLEYNVDMQFLTFLGESSYKLGLADEAFTYFEELILLDPNNLPILNNYSYYLSLEGKNLERAEKLSYKTILSEPVSPIYLDTYGWILFKQGKFDEAIVFLEKASQLSNDPDVLFHFAEALLKTGENQKACDYYKKAQEAGYDQESIMAKLTLCL